MITVVSGLPRSGTSLMMQMLEAGGMPVLIDGHRPADADNPRGYYEYEPVKRLQQDSSWLARAEGMAVKIVSPLLTCLPTCFDYRVIMMCRNLEEVLCSQEQMLQRRGEPAGADRAAMRGHFERHINKTRQWASQQQHLRVLECQFAALLETPEHEIERIAQFLDCDLVAGGRVRTEGPRDAALHLDRQAMARVIDPDLRRQQER